jgi:hypothetical protein
VVCIKINREAAVMDDKKREREREREREGKKVSFHMLVEGGD